MNDLKSSNTTAVVPNVTFNPTWYARFVAKSNEKHVLPNVCKCIIERIIGDKQASCLEIGLGTTPHFVTTLADHFDRYIVIEKENVLATLPPHVVMITEDWENLSVKETFDVIIASHVVYYFKHKQQAIQKIFKTLKPGGVVLFIVNAKEGDYGLVKSKFAQLTNQEHMFTYDWLKNILADRINEEISVPAKIIFEHPRELFETLRLSFDHQPDLYQAHKHDLLVLFEKLFGKRQQFLLHQKIFVCSRSDAQ